MKMFTSKGKEAIEEIRRCMRDAQQAFDTLTAVENHACWDFHNEGASLNHCIRFGLLAADEIHAAQSESVEA